MWEFLKSLDSFLVTIVICVASVVFMGFAIVLMRKMWRARKITLGSLEVEAPVKHETNPAYKEAYIKKEDKNGS